MKYPFNHLIVFILLILIAVSCEVYENSGQTECLKGKYLGDNCQGVAIQILEEHRIAQDWVSIDGKRTYTNAVVASIDTIYAQQAGNIGDYFSGDSIFYFQYINGGYPRYQYIFCEPSPLSQSLICPKNPVYKIISFSLNWSIFNLFLLLSTFSCEYESEDNKQPFSITIILLNVHGISSTLQTMILFNHALTSKRKIFTVDKK
ncbi:MAG: hypothetical protein U5K79_14520 [Cyclobacteriaceae bacterium]|nr:hypothetical protein [Cyclobacteriaceae bacterium]